MADQISTAEPAMTTTGPMALVRPLVSTRKPESAGRGNLFILALLLRLAGAGLLVWIGWVHWHLWSEGYKHIHIDGPAFIVDAVVAVVLAVVLLAWPRPLIGLISALFVASTILALLVSLNFSLFGFQESTQASFVVQALVYEGIALIVLAAWTLLASGLLRTRS
jgi:hypothetical protein